jgi:hypothetical protein
VVAIQLPSVKDGKKDEFNTGQHELGKDSLQFSGPQPWELSYHSSHKGIRISQYSSPFYRPFPFPASFPSNALQTLQLPK